MNILLNLVPLKSGGGVQVGMDFISNIQSYGSMHQWYIFCSEDTPFTEIKLPPNCTLLGVSGRSIFKRFFFEYLKAPKIAEQVKIDIAYTQFGPQPSIKGVKQIVGCAYSNLFYPEVDFWEGNSFFKKVERHLYDWMRLTKLKQADLVVFETEDLAVRAISQGHLPKDKAIYSLPAVSSNINLSKATDDVKKKMAELPRAFKLCQISSYGRHKNMECFVPILAEFKKRYPGEKILIVITLAEDHPKYIEIVEDAKANGVEDNIVTIGPVPFESCAEIYHKCDAAILLSKLESFSNNIAEAWAMQRPIIINEASWSRSICEEGAVYVQAENAASVADEIYSLIVDNDHYQEIVKNGSDRLNSFPNSEQRFKNYLKIIEESEVTN